MLIRRIVTTAVIGALAVGAVPLVAGAQSGPGISVPRTTIVAGDSLTVTITTPCTAGEHGYGSVNQYIDGWYKLDGTKGEIVQQTYKRDSFEGYASGVFEFPEPGTYTLRNYCGDGEVGSIEVTVVEKNTTPTTETPTTAAPVDEEPTTTVPSDGDDESEEPTTTTAPEGDGDDPEDSGEETGTTTPVEVKGSTAVNTPAAPGATASAATRVSYAG